MNKNKKQKQNFGGAEKTSTFSSKSLEIIRNNRQKLHSLFNKAIILTLFAVCVAYIGTINDLSIKGFILEDLKKDIAKLEVQNEQHELEAMSLESYELINTRARKLGMVKVDDVQYVSIIDGAVAKK